MNPTSTPIDAVLLDLDGTLVDSIPDLAQAANAMRADIGLSALPQATIATYVGKGIDKLVERAMAGSMEAPTPGAGPLDVARASFYQHYHAVNGQRTTIYPGVLDGLRAMQAMGLALAVVTNKSTEFTLPLLARTGLAPYFAAVVCGDTCARKKPDPMPFLHACTLLGTTAARSVVIGDSLNDTQAGRAAGAQVLVVPYGYNEGQDVRTLEVDGIVDTLLDAAAWIERKLVARKAESPPASKFSETLVR
jgi:phosphoglycolate phosphatase